ncbi:alpha/beta hydrolase [Poriferisphaera sp. WC338]|uniref:alpha/beta hydrolase n=1 Tax=Poriferisphaera sp. WC338 TaxID=3425129 RepID=UPI003D816BA6
MDDTTVPQSSRVLALWPSQSPSILPTLAIYPASKPNNINATILILPGGGYEGHADYEGHDIAVALNKQGFDAAVLKYRVAPHQHPAPIHDVQRAIRLIKKNASQYNLRADKIAVLGFSAGGHLASTLAVHWDQFISPEDDFAQLSARPDAVVLCYPVIDLDGEASHVGSRENLLGQDAPQDLRQLMSTHMQVRLDSPPTFVWHTMTDEAVPVENAILFAQACRAKQVPVEMHLYEKGRHGLALLGEVPGINSWFDHAVQFLERHLI